MAVSTSDDIYQELWDFAIDETQLMGDISVNVCGITQEFEDDTLRQFYEEFQDSLSSEGIEVTAIPLEIIYKGQDAAAFEDSTGSEWTTAILTTAITEAADLISLVIGILLSRREKHKGKKNEPVMDGPEIL